MKRETGRDNIRIWAGECHVHAGISGPDLVARTEENPEADLYIHPECGCANSAIYLAGEGLVDESRVHMLSTGQMLDEAKNQQTGTVLVATEVGMLHQLRQTAPDIDFKPVNERAACAYMKMITPAALIRALALGVDEVDVPKDIADAARESLERMIAVGQSGLGE